MNKTMFLVASFFALFVNSLALGQPNLSVKDKCRTTSARIAVVGSVAGMKVGKYRAGLSGGETFASYWVTVRSIVLSDVTALRNALALVNITNDTINEFVGGSNPTSTQELDSIALAVRQSCAAVVEE